MKVSRFALVTALVAAPLLTLAPAQAQRAPGSQWEQRSTQGDRQTRQQQPQIQAGERTFDLSNAERQAIVPLAQAVTAQDWAAAQAALPAAQAAAQGADAKYVIGQYMLRIGLSTQNRQLQSQAVDALLASGGAQPQEIPALLSTQADLAIQAQDYAKAEHALNRMAESNPNDPRLLGNLAQLRLRRDDRAGALEIYQRLIQAQEAAGQTVSEEDLRRALAIAFEGRMAPQSMDYAQRLVRTYPAPTNVRDSLLIFTQLNNADEPLQMDVMRLMRTANAMTGEADYVAFADMLIRDGLVGEAKAVLEAGISAGKINRSSANVSQLLGSANARVEEDRASLERESQQAEAGSARQMRRIADALAGYGRHADAVALYRAALAKGGEDASLINIRLGAALAQAGQRGEAEAAFRAVTGPRQGLANLWLAWLARSGA